MTSPRIVFMGTGDIALPSFTSLLDMDVVGNVVGLVTQPDKPVGRKQILTPPKIKTMASAHEIPVFQPGKVSDAAFLDQLQSLAPDIMVVMAYGQILSQAVLDVPKLACINLHASLLPLYRGAACIQAAIDAGDSQTGITVMHMVKALDAGDIILQSHINIGSQETGGELHNRLAELAPKVLGDALEQLSSGQASRSSQDVSRVSYIPKLMRSDGEIDWAVSAKELERRIRAYDPWPGTSTSFTEKKGRHKGRHRRLKIFPPVLVVEGAGDPGEIIACDGDRFRVACGDGAIQISCLQPDGSRRMKVSDFLLGEPVEVGDTLVSPTG